MPVWVSHETLDLHRRHSLLALLCSRDLRLLGELTSIALLGRRSCSRHRSQFARLSVHSHCGLLSNRFLSRFFLWGARVPYFCAIPELEMAPRWCAERFGVFLVVAVLVFSPLLCSAWSDNREFVEQQGNSSFLCKSSGPCVACSRPEKDANKFHCRTSGYHQSFKCLEMKGAEKTENKRDVKHLSGDGTSSEDRGTIGAGEGRNLVETPAFKIEGGLKTYLTYKSCTPAELRMDKFSVWQFEAVAFASFALCSPLVYYRRKHSFSGMTRLPTSNPRF